jgi:hypothetical protein
MIYMQLGSIWEISCGRIPFEDIVDEDDLENLIGAGLRPDISIIDNEEVAKLIVTYLDSDDRVISPIKQPEGEGDDS